MKLAVAVWFGLVATVSTVEAQRPRDAEDRGGGIDLPMQWDDVITIEGTRYGCNARIRGGVTLQPGDRVSAGRFRVKCARRDNSDGGDVQPPGPPPPQTSSLTSAVDTRCLSQVYQTISGRVPPASAPMLAEACRPMNVPRVCRETSSAPDAGCFRQLDQIISGSFSANDGAEAQRACRRVEASCAFEGTRKASARVDMTCVSQLYQKTSGRPNGAAIVQWIDGCRSQTRGRCQTVASSFDQACYTQAYQFVSGRPTIEDAARIARACTAHELLCD
jgi:hypothetical protein